MDNQNDLAKETGLNHPLVDELHAMQQQMDDVYYERNRIVAALAKCFPSGVVLGEEWHCVYIDLPTGQVSWHFNNKQSHLFEGFPPYTQAWDQHDTEEKYRRVDALQPDSLKNDEKWLIWSNEHRAWWGPNNSGYYTKIESAGLYSFADAKLICDQVCIRGLMNRSGVDVPPETMVSAIAARRLKRHGA